MAAVAATRMEPGICEVFGSESSVIIIHLYAAKSTQHDQHTLCCRCTIA